MSGILAGKRILVTGVLTESSIAFHAAKVAQEEGAEVVLTGYGRLSLVERIAKRLPKPAPVIELDVQNAEHLDRLAGRISEHLGEGVGLDGIVHSIAFGPQDALGGNFLHTPWESVATAVEVSAYSLKSLTMACLPLMQNGGSVVGLTSDAQYAWPQYDWMGPAKAALEATSRYMARDLGKQNIRCNLVSAGPIGSMAAKSIPGFSDLAAVWDHRSPLEWDLKDPEPAGKGIVVHRLECPNVPELRKLPERCIEMAWAADVQGDYRVELRIDVANKPGVLAQVASGIASAKSNIENVEYKERDTETATLLFTIEVRNRKHRADVIRQVRRLHVVNAVRRHPL